MRKPDFSDLSGALRRLVRRGRQMLGSCYRELVRWSPLLRVSWADRTLPEAGLCMAHLCLLVSRRQTPAQDIRIILITSFPSL